MGGQWMIETGKNVPDPTHEMKKIIKTLTIIYDKITDILEELICVCYFDDVKSIVKAIKTKEYNCMEGYGNCEKILKLCKDFEDKHSKLEDICKEIMKE